MSELSTIGQMMLGTRTSFFYHRPLRELFVVLSCIWMTSCNSTFWEAEHNSTVKDRTMAAEHNSTVNDRTMAAEHNSTVNDRTILQDQIAAVGKIFLYHIPNQIKERNLSLQVTEAGSESLPGWLKFVNDDSTLCGVATVMDIGYHYISVTVISTDNQFSRTHFSDVFTIDVILVSPAAETKGSDSEPIDRNIDSSFSLTYEPRLVTCIPDQPHYSATIIIGTSFQQLNGQARVEIALRFAEFVFRSPVDITLSPRKSASVTRLLKKSIVAAGAGIADEKPSEESVEISWTVSCNYQFRVEDFTRIIEHNVLSGTLKDVIGFSVLGWYITRDEPRIKAARFRRQANGIARGTPVPTPSLTMVTPTNVVSTRSFSFPSTSIYIESTITIEPTLSTLIRTVDFTTSLDLITTSLSPAIFMTSSPIIMTSSPAISSSSSDVITMLTSEFFPSTSFIMMSTSLASSEPISSFIPELTSSTIKDIEPSTSSITISPSYFSISSPPIYSISHVTSEATASSEFSSVESSTIMATAPSTIVPFSTESLPTSLSLMVSTVTDIPPSSLTITSLPETSQVSSVKSSESTSLATPIISSTILSSFVTTSSPEISVGVSSDILQTSTEFQSSAFVTSSSFMLPLTTSSVDDYTATSSLLEESSILLSSVFSSPFLSSSFYGPRTSLPSSSSLIESSVGPPLTSFSSFLSSSLIETSDIFVLSSLPSHILSSMPSVSTSSQQIQTSTSFKVDISSSEMSTVVGPQTSFPSFMSSSMVQTPDIFPTSSQALQSSTMPPSFSTSSQQIQMSSSLGSAVSSQLPTSLYISSTLMASSTFITPSQVASSSFPSSSVMETTVPSMVPTPALSTSFMVPLSSISSTSIPNVISSAIMPTLSISSGSVMISSSLPFITPEPVNQRPVVLNAINHITIKIGRILSFSIPADTFHDPEDGNTRNLELKLLTTDNKPLEGASWVRMDVERQVIYGLAVETVLISQKIVYNLFATDSNGYSVFDALYVEVLPDPFTYTHQYLVTFSNNYHEFASDINNAINVCQRLADYYGDPNTNMITVASVTEGSVVYGYSNNSISQNVCDKDVVNREYSRLAYANGSVNVGLTIIMQPKYSVIAVEKEFKGVCLPKPQTTESPNLIAGKQSSEKIVSVSVIIPAVVCTLLILLIGVCYCCCYKHKRHGEEFLLREERDMFVGNRKPIFLDNELEPRPANAAEPVVLPKDISPFLPSPMAVNLHLESRPSPPSYLNEAYEKDDPDAGIPMSPLFFPPAYSPQPIFNRLPPSYLDPPTYRLPPAYESEDVGIFETTKI